MPPLAATSTLGRNKSAIGSHFTSADHGGMIAHMERTAPDDPLDVLNELMAVLDHSELDPPLRYALTVILVAQEVRDTVTGPFPRQLQQRISDLLDEVQIAATAAQPVPLAQRRAQ